MLISIFFHAVKIYDTGIGCTQCLRAYPLDVLEMVLWDGCKRWETAFPTNFLGIRVYLVDETSRSIGLAY